MFCTECGKAPTKHKTNSKGGNRTINPITKVCNECEQRNNGDTSTGVGGAIRKDNANGAVIDGDPEIPAIPEDIVNKPGSELSANDIYTIVTAAIQGTNKKIDDLKDNIQNKIVTLENKVKILENENEKKDEDINILKHTVVSMQKAFNSMDQGERSKNAVIQHLSEKDIYENESGINLTNDLDKIRQICKVMNCNLDEDSLNDVSRIGKVREGVPRMLKLVFASMKDRDAFVKNSSRLKEAPEMWKKVYIKKDQHPVYVAENHRLRKKMVDLRKLPENKDKEILIKDGKLTVQGSVVDQNLFFH